MGQDKALLPYKGTVLVERIAREVAAAAGSATLVGAHEGYGSLGLPSIGDRRTGCGPLGGLEASLAATSADWNLVVACDMPNVSAGILKLLLQRAEEAGVDCLMPVSGSGRCEPLCAVWHRRCLPAVEAALAAGVRKMTDVLDTIRSPTWEAPTGDWAVNLNTPEEWEAHR